jgi:hypothetical protein
LATSWSDTPFCFQADKLEATKASTTNSQSHKRTEVRLARASVIDRIRRPEPIASINPFERNSLDEAELIQRGNPVIQPNFLNDLAVLEAQDSFRITDEDR